MDSSHQHQQQQHNWLAFSLSNHHMASDSSQLCLFEAFHQNPSRGIVRGEGNGSARTDFSTVLNCTTSSPKLEDFLGGTNDNNNGSSSTGAPSDVCHHLSTETSSSVVVYDSELKSIAASFLRGYTAGQHSEVQKQLVALPPSDRPPAKKPTETFGQRTSIYRGVTRHRWTGRYEAHLWDNTCRREGQSRKGRQVYLGGYDKEEKAARAYDLAALKYWGPTTTTNFPVSNYEKELEEMKHMTRQEFVASLRRKSSGFSRGASIYRGVTRHHQHGRWQARIGRVAGNKDLYLGTFSTQEEAAEAYDIAAIKFRGLNAVTNFDISRYDVKSIASSNLPIGGTSNKSKTNSSESMSDHNNNNNNSSNIDGHRGAGAAGAGADDFSSAASFASQPSTTSTTTLSFGLPVKQQDGHFWSSLGQYHGSGFNVGGGAKNPNMLFQSCTCSSTSTATTFNVDYPATTASDNSNGYFNIGGGESGTSYFEQQNTSTESAVPLVTRIALSSNQSSTTAYDASSYGNWISPAAMHSFQPAKQNLSVVFQTPIFGME